MSKKFYEDYYKPLNGAKILKTFVIEEDGHYWLNMEVQIGAQTFQLEVTSDEEGNGAGFIHGVPEKVKK